MRACSRCIKRSFENSLTLGRFLCNSRSQSHQHTRTSGCSLEQRTFFHILIELYYHLYYEINKKERNAFESVQIWRLNCVSPQVEGPPNQASFTAGKFNTPPRKTSVGRRSAAYKQHRVELLSLFSALPFSIHALILYLRTKPKILKINPNCNARCAVLLRDRVLNSRRFSFHVIFAHREVAILILCVDILASVGKENSGKIKSITECLPKNQPTAKRHPPNVSWF